MCDHLPCNLSFVSVTFTLGNQHLLINASQVAIRHAKMDTLQQEIADELQTRNTNI